MRSSEIPVAHTPPGGYGATFPPLILGDCTEQLVAGVPDLRGIWKTVSATRGGVQVPPDDRLMSYTERIEENGVHDVSVFDYTTPIHVVASYEDSVFVLRPVGMPGIEVTRQLDQNGNMIWQRPDMGGVRVVLQRAVDAV
jgi:hypothetical protein